MFYWNGFGPLSEPPPFFEAELWPRSKSYNGPFHHEIFKPSIHCNHKLVMWLSSFLLSEDLLIIHSEVTKCNTESFLLKPLYLLLEKTSIVLFFLVCIASMVLHFKIFF